MRELIIEAKTDNMNQLTKFVLSFLAEMKCPHKEELRIRVSVEEVYVNIAHYAYNNTDIPTEEQTAKILFDSTDDGDVRSVSITFIDKGIPYNPLEKKDPDVTLPAEDRQIGGLGIYMVKKSMDDVRYVYEDNQNKLTIVKKFIPVK